MVKIGVKTYYDKYFAEYFKDKADFLELMAVDGKDYSFLINYPLPIVIHAQHQKFGFNPADSTKKEINEKSINFAIKTANMLNADKIIVHPGVVSDENCSINNSINFFKNLNDDRIIIENLPMRDANSLCTTPEEMKAFLKEVNKGFCFDFNHAISTAKFLEDDYLKVINEFMKDFGKPEHYHIGGQILSDGDRGHLSLSDSDINVGAVLKSAHKGAHITLETTTSIEEVEKDLKIAREMMWNK